MINTISVKPNKVLNFTTINIHVKGNKSLLVKEEAKLFKSRSAKNCTIFFAHFEGKDYHLNKGEYINFEALYLLVNFFEFKKSN